MSKILNPARTNVIYQDDGTITNLLPQLIEGGRKLILDLRR